MKRQTNLLHFVVISVLLGSAVHVMPVSAYTPQRQASGGFAERTGSYDFDMFEV